MGVVFSSAFRQLNPLEQCHPVGDTEFITDPGNSGRLGVSDIGKSFLMTSSSIRLCDS